jgi:pimeloyl-ACP methyl ester carboxylesterase
LLADMAKKAFDSGRIFGVTHGTAPFRVLALPGWLHTAADWDATLRSLTDEAGGVALDLPGFGGATPEPEEATGSGGYAERVEPVLDELVAGAGGPIVVVGHSFGGRVALHLAARRPDAVSALVLTGVPRLVAPEGPVTKPALSYRVARWLHRRGVFPDSRMEALRKKSGSADYRNAPSVTMRNVLVAVTNEVYEEQLRALRCPVELVWGEADTAAPIADARRAADLLGGATLTELPDVDHFTPIKAPDALATAIRRHL